ncbi:Uncharacterized protein TCM_026178 [Theobroma cacao]|uniref:Uncharacterized protein n=1 Tax=Theobroma cacao TaxID=3641 RepID=A0A061F1F9_THECC|nr:Uncharacterized protein TCM_026178 [Theobroma cacao]
MISMVVRFELKMLGNVPLLCFSTSTKFVGGVLSFALTHTCFALKTVPGPLFSPCELWFLNKESQKPFGTLATVTIVDYESEGDMMATEPCTREKQAIICPVGDNS